MQWDWKVLVGIMVAAVVAGWFLTRTVHEPTVDDSADLDRELAELAQALRGDQAIGADIIPPLATGVHFPSSLPYRRPTDFWRSVLGETRRIHGARRGRR